MKILGNKIDNGLLRYKQQHNNAGVTASFKDYRDFDDSLLQNRKASNGKGV